MPVCLSQSVPVWGSAIVISSPPKPRLSASVRPLRLRFSGGVRLGVRASGRRGRPGLAAPGRSGAARRFAAVALLVPLSPGSTAHGAEDGIRTRDPHLGKVSFFVSLVGPAPLSCCSVHSVSTSSTQFALVVERSTIDAGPQRFGGSVAR